MVARIGTRDPEVEFGPDELHDIEAETATLSGMFDPESLAEVVEICEPGDFHRPAHQIIARLMIDMWAQGLHIDQVTLWDYMVKLGETQCLGDRGRMYLHDLWGYPAARVGAAYHARIVREFSVRRRLDQAGIRLQQRAAHRSQDTASLIQAMEAQLAEIQDLAEHQPGVDGVMTVAQFAVRELVRARPVIPGMLDAMDRVIVVARPGTGKTHLALQVAFCAAAGLHPFTLHPIPPVKVLILDLENPAGILQRRLRSFRRVAKSVETFDESNLMIFHRPGGLDLRNAKDAQQLTGVIRQTKPDLIVGGPIYKMLIDQGEGAEHLHSGITAYWDRIRAIFGPALWLETHPPVGAKTELRPTGSGIYSRWPEFGLTMERAKESGKWDIGRFRDDREEGRTFPTRVDRTVGWGDVWPFTGHYADGLPPEPMEPEVEVISE